MTAKSPTHGHGRTSVLDDVRDWWTTYLAFQSNEDADLIALWTLHSHAYQQGWTTPRLILQSVRRGSGKSTALEHLQRLGGGDVARNGSVPSKSLLVRDASKGNTLLFDEIDKWPSGEDRRAVFGVLNEGWSAEGTVRVNEQDPETGKWDAAPYPVFAPIAMAGLHRYGEVPEDVFSRALTVHLKPGTTGTYTKTRWAKLHAPAEELKAEIEAWAEGVTLPEVEPSDELDGRRADAWEPILQIAQSIGDDWPDRVHAMIEAEIVTTMETTETEHRTLWQLASHDTYLAWTDDNQPLGDVAPTREILARLHRINPIRWDGDWGILTPRRYAEYMAEGGVHPVRFYLDNERVRGYRRVDHESNWLEFGLLPDGNVVRLWKPSDVA